MPVAWLIASILGVIVMLLPGSIAVSDGHYIPVGNDSFYHGSRILDLIADPSNLHEFDPRIHAPEGSLLTWPWGYDYFMSLIVRGGLALGVSREAMAIADHIPVVFFPLAVALVMLIAYRLGASRGAIALAGFATALFPFNQALYAVGNIDHHWAEHLFVLGSLAAALAWLRQPTSSARAIACGVVLGVAPCIHNGLFVLQLPLTAAFVWLWVRGVAPLSRTSAFSVALVAATLLAALPSQSFREGRFEFVTLSWFHAYASICTALVCTAVSRFKFSLPRLVVLMIVCAGLVAPLAGQIILGSRFLSSTVEGMQQISEAQSLWKVITQGAGAWSLTRYYSLLIFTLPAIFAWCAFRLWREHEAPRVLFWIACLFGLTMVVTQLRLQYFGSYALYLPWILLVDERFRASAADSGRALGVAAAALLVAYLPAMKFVLFTPKIMGNDPYYALTYDIYPDFARECAEAPGIALAALDDGHPIRYHTKCSVLANNFLLTKLHEEKVREQRALMQLSPQSLLEQAPFVRYVYVRRNSLFTMLPNGGLKFLPGGDPDNPDPALVNALLAASPGELPARYRLVKELAFEKPAHIVFARLYAIAPAERSGGSGSGDLRR
jgi:hypothetical protein